MIYSHSVTVYIYKNYKDEVATFARSKYGTLQLIEWILNLSCTQYEYKVTVKQKLNEYMKNKDNIFKLDITTENARIMAVISNLSYASEGELLAHIPGMLHARVEVDGVVLKAEQQI